MLLKSIFDNYERNARLYPALIALLPLCVGVGHSISWVIGIKTTILSTIIYLGVALLLGNIARDLGKRKERQLFDSWHGAPSVSILFTTDMTINSESKKIYHTALAKLTNIKAPTKQTEAKDIAKATTIYAAWSDFLRQKTRDKKKYELVYKENVNYGFRRNLLGLKPIAACSSIISLFMIILNLPNHIDLSTIMTLTFIGVYSLLIMFYIKPSWVKIVADEYAKRLIEATGTLNKTHALKFK